LYPKDWDVIQTQETADFRDAELYELLYKTVSCKLTKLW